MMFNASQIPDNPGYMDFNNPSLGGTVGGQQPQQQSGQKKKNQKNKQKNKPQQQVHQFQQNGNWNKNKNQQVMNNNRFGNLPQRGFNQQGRPMANRGRRMMPPVAAGGMRGGPMPPMPHIQPNAFQAPMIPPIPPMGRCPMPPMGGNPPFMRRGRGPMPPIPPPVPPMMGPIPRVRRGPLGGLPPPMPPVPFAPGGKIKKPNPKVVKKVVKGKSSIKTLKNMVNQYPVDKPWVTDEIRAEHDKKVDIENRLKGNKDDELFAQFKTQRDKFVSMYEKAREEYLKSEAASVKAKDDKDKQTSTTAATDGNKEANANV